MTNFAPELARVTNYWTPRVVGEVNDQFVKVAKLKGELVWQARATRATCPNAGSAFGRVSSPFPFPLPPC